MEEKMNQVRNYQKELDNKIKEIKQSQTIPTLLLHSCCAPCSSYCLEYLSQYFSITIFYYNPNITAEWEYKKRVEEQKRFLQEFPVRNPIHFIEGVYEREKFFELSKGLEKEKEGGERCFLCYEMRLREAAKIARKLQFNYMTTTLSISPMKNAHKLNEIGERIAKEFQVHYLSSDFKKRNGYKRSIELSRQYNLYRQDYCGCIYSKQEREQKMTEVDKNIEE